MHWKTKFVILQIYVIVSSTEWVISTKRSTKTKRQLYREHLLPDRGGKIPDSAFQVDRLAANRLNKEGISIPDGVLLEQRHHESHFGAHRFDPDIERSIIRIKQTPDGRYTPVEGRYPVFDNEIYSTYIIRPPIYEKYKLVLPPFAPNFASQSVEIPSRLTQNKDLSPKSNQNFHRNRLDHNSLLYNKPQPPQASGPYYYPKPEPPRNSLEWSAWNSLFPELFYQSIGFETNRNKGYIPDFPSLTQIPITSFVCDHSGKMYADPEAKCQAFHLCHYNGNKETFLCPPGTRYDEITSECSPWYKTQCLAH